MKRFYVQYNIGRVKYFLNYSVPGQFHPDGSQFWGSECFRNQRKLAARMTEMKAQGYTERP